MGTEKRECGCPKDHCWKDYNTDNVMCKLTKQVCNPDVLASTEPGCYIRKLKKMADVVDNEDCECIEDSMVMCDYCEIVSFLNSIGEQVREFDFKERI